MTALVTYEVGGRTYPLVASRRCQMCRSPRRREIEALLIDGATFAESARIHRDSGLSARNVGEHIRRGHLPVEHEVVRRIVAQQVQEQIAHIESGVTAKLAMIVLAHTTVKSVLDKMLTGNLAPTVSHAIRMAKLLADSEQALRAERQIEAQLRQSHEGFEVFFAIARSLMSTSVWGDFLHAAHEDERLRAYLPHPGSSSN